MNNSKKLPLISKVGYLFGDFGSQFCWTFIGSYLSVFYTDIVGLAPVVVTTIFLIARIWDAINDPMMGAIAERTHTKWGRFRPYMAFGAPILAIFSTIVFVNPNFSTNGKIAFAVITYILAGMLYTMVNIPYGALAGVMTSDVEERSSLAAFRMLGMNMGMLIINAVAMPLILHFSKSDTPVAKGYTYTALVFAIVGCISFYITYFTSKEVVQPVQKKKVPIKDTVKTIFTPHIIKVALIQFFVMCGFMGRVGVVVYYYMYVLKRMDKISFLMTLQSIGGIIGIVCIVKIAAKLGKKTTVVVSNILSAISMIAIFFIPASNITLITIVTFIFGLVSGSAPLILSMLADAIDYEEYQTGIRADGAAYATNGLASKAGTAVAGIGVSIMAAFGYVANAEQTTGALRGINITTNLIPAVFFILAAIIALTWKLDEKRAQQIRNELDERIQKSNQDT